MELRKGREDKKWKNVKCVVYVEIKFNLELTLLTLQGIIENETLWRRVELTLIRSPVIKILRLASVFINQNSEL